MAAAFANLEGLHDGFAVVHHRVAISKTGIPNEPRGREMIEVNGSHSQIRSFILEKFPAARKRALSDDLPLLECGIVDSLGVLDVVGFLERTFKITIEDEELTPDNFGNIKSMASFVERKIDLSKVSVLAK